VASVEMQVHVPAKTQQLGEDPGSSGDETGA